MGVGEDLVTHLLGPGVLAPVLGKGDVETLRAGVAVDLFGGVEAVLFGAVEIGEVGEDEATVVGGVFAQREIAVDLDVVLGGCAGANSNAPTVPM